MCIIIKCIHITILVPMFNNAENYLKDKTPTNYNFKINNYECRLCFTNVTFIKIDV